VSTLDNPNADKPLHERVSTQTGVKLPEAKQAAAPPPPPAGWPVNPDLERRYMPPGAPQEYELDRGLVFTAGGTTSVVSSPLWDVPPDMGDFTLMILRTSLLRALRKVDTAAHDRGLTPSPIMTIGG